MEMKIQSIFTCLNLPTTSDDQLQKIDSAVQSYVKKLKCEVEDYQSKFQQANFDRNQLLEQIQIKDKDFECLKQKLLTQQTDRNKTIMKDLESKNLSMIEENKNVKHQVYILQEQIRKMQTNIDGAAREKCLLQQEIKDLKLRMVRGLTVGRMIRVTVGGRGRFSASLREKYLLQQEIKVLKLRMVRITVGGSERGFLDFIKVSTFDTEFKRRCSIGQRHASS